ncbi:hypothetical protein YC2023_066300 [Brassica napus]
MSFACYKVRVHTGRPCVSISTHKTSVAVHVCPSAHTERQWLSISTHISTLVLGLSTLAIPVDCLGDFGPRGLSVQYTQDVRGCPPAHTGHLWLSVSTHMTFVAVCVCPCVSVRTHRTSVAVHQCTYQHAGPWTQHAGPSRGLFQVIFAHKGCLVSTHRTSVGVRQHTQDVCGYPSAHTRRLWLSVCVRRHTQDFCGCPCVSVYVRVCPSAHTGRLWLSISTHISMLVLGLSTLTLPVACSIHTGRQWLSISTHISTLVLGLSTLALPVDCLGDFGPRGQSVQYTQDVRGCPPAHTGRLWLSVSTHMMFVAVCVCPCVSVRTQRTFVAVHQCTYQHAVHTGRPWVAVSTHRTSLGVHQHTQDVRGCPCVSVDTHKTSVASVCVCVCPCVSVYVRVCPSAHTGRLWLSISTHISMLVLGLSTLTLPVACSSDLGPRGQSVQYTQDVRGSPPAHTRRPWLYVCVCACLSVSISTHRTSVAVHQYTYQHSVQYTQDVRGCPPAHTGRLWLSDTQDVCGCPLAHTGRPCVSVRTHRTCVAVRVCPSVSVSTHRTSVAVHQYTYQHVVHTGRPWVSASTHRMSVAVRQHTQDVRGCPCVSVCVRQHTQNVYVCPSAHTGRLWLTLTLPVDSLGDFGPRGPSVQYTQDVVGVRQHTQDICGCPSAHTGRMWLFVAVRVCPLAHTGRPWLSISTHISMLAFPVDCSGDFGPRRLSVQYTQDVRGCRTHISTLVLGLSSLTLPVDCSANTGRLWLSISTHISTLVLGLSTLTLPMDCSGDFGPLGLSVQYTQDVCWCPPAHTGRLWLYVCVCACLSVSVSTHRTSVAVHQTSVGVRQHTQDVRVCPSAHTGRPCVSVSTHRTSVAVCGCPSAHTGHMWVSVSKHKTSVAVRVCPSAHTGRLWLSISTHICMLVLGLSTLTLPVDCSGEFSPRRLSVQYTQDVCGCPPAHTGRLWLSVCVRVCPCVSVSKHRTSVAVHHTHMTSVGVRQHTQDVCGCTCVFVRVCLCPSAHTGRPWLSISTHISMLVLGLSTLTLPVECLGDFGPCGLSVKYTQDVCGCPSAHTGRPCVSVSTHRTSVAVLGCPSEHTGRPWVSVSTHKTSVAVRVCPSEHTGCLWLSISTHICMLVLGLSTLTLPVDCSGDFSPRGLSVQYTQDVCGCPPAHTGRPWLSVCVRVCLSGHTGRLWLSISIHISMFVHRLNMLALPVDCLGDFGPRRLSVQYTQDVHGCPPAHAGCPWLSVAVRQHTYDVRCLFSTHRTSVGVRQHTQDVHVSFSTHRTSMAVRVCPSAHTRRLWLSVSTHISTLVLGLSTLTLPVDCSGDFGPRGLSVQYTQDVHWCPPADTGRSWLYVFVCACPSVSVSTHRTSVAVHQYTYQHVGPWTQHAGPSRRLFG